MNVLAYLQPRPEGGCDTYRNVNLLAAGQIIKAGPGVLYGWYISNQAAALRVIKFYNKATAATVGTDAPFLTIAMPANKSESVYFGPGVQFTVGIGIAATNLAADNDATAPTAGDVIVNIFYR